LCTCLTLDALVARGAFSAVSAWVTLVTLRALTVEGVPDTVAIDVLFGIFNAVPVKVPAA
jgi:hypothetical protein